MSAAAVRSAPRTAGRSQAAPALPQPICSPAPSVVSHALSGTHPKIGGEGAYGRPAMEGGVSITVRGSSLDGGALGRAESLGCAHRGNTRAYRPEAGEQHVAGVLLAGGAEVDAGVLEVAARTARHED